MRRLPSAQLPPSLLICWSSVINSQQAHFFLVTDWVAPSTQCTHLLGHQSRCLGTLPVRTASICHTTYCAGSRRPLDAAGVMDTMHESHVQELLPRLAAGDAVLARFADHCLECKVPSLFFWLGKLGRSTALYGSIGLQ